MTLWGDAIAITDIARRKSCRVTTIAGLCLPTQLGFASNFEIQTRLKIPTHFMLGLGIGNINC